MILDTPLIIYLFGIYLPIFVNIFTGDLYNLTGFLVFKLSNRNQNLRRAMNIGGGVAACCICKTFCIL